MKMAGEQRIEAPREQVWAALNDPEVLRQCIPGCQTLEKESPERMRAVAEIKIGPIGARFVGAVTLSDLDPPNGYTITGEGQGGTVGFAKGGAKVRLAGEGSGTLLSYDVDAQVGGRLAQLGGPIIDATAKQMAGRFFQKFGAIVGTPAEAADGEADELPHPPAAAGAFTAPAPSIAPAPPTASRRPALAPPPAAPRLPMAWVLAVAFALLAGFVVGRHGGADGSPWEGIAIGLVLIVVAVVGFEYGRHAAAPVITLDERLARRLARLGEEPDA